MESFKNADAGVIVDQLIHKIQEQRDYLSEIDGKIGDGDHGINMNKGFTMCEEKLKGQTYNLSEGLSILGETLLDDIGGSMGPLYGMLFDEMSMACEDAEDIDADMFGEMISGAVEGIQEISPAKVGDKSLLDTLVPAKEAFVQAKEEGKDFSECLNANECGGRERMAVNKESSGEDWTRKPPWREIKGCAGCGSHQLLLYHYNYRRRGKRTFIKAMYQLFKVLRHTIRDRSIRQEKSNAGCSFYRKK